MSELAYSTFRTLGQGLGDGCRGDMASGVDNMRHEHERTRKTIDVLAMRMLYSIVCLFCSHYLVLWLRFLRAGLIVPGLLE